MERRAFLARVREQLQSESVHRSPDPWPGDEPVPRMGWPDDDRPLPDSFLEAVRSHGGSGRRVSDEHSLRELLSEIVAHHGIATAVVTDEPATVGVADVLADLGVHAVPFDGPRSAEADLGVTGAVAAIARTGTVVVDSAVARGRTASLLPEVHLVLLTAESLVGEPSDYWRGLPGRYPDGLPSQVVLITGPSKSADIEGALTVGVHGPRSVWVGLMDPPAADEAPVARE